MNTNNYENEHGALIQSCGQFSGLRPIKEFIKSGLYWLLNQVARDFLTMFPESSNGMLRWPIMSKKILKLLNGNKDRTLWKLLDALIPEEEQCSGSENPSGK
jgi:hypothetical protein